MTTLAQRITKTIDSLYRPPFSGMMPRQTFRYIACGGINWAITTVVFWASFNFLLAKQHIAFGPVVIASHTMALGISVPFSFLFGFWMQRNISFRSSPLRGRTQLFRYFLNALVAGLITWLLEKLLVEMCNIYPTVAFTTIYLTTAVIGFIAQKHFIFRGAAKD